MELNPAEESLPEILSLLPSSHYLLPCQRLLKFRGRRAGFAKYAGIILGFDNCKCLANEVLLEKVYNACNWDALGRVVFMYREYKMVGKKSFEYLRQSRASLAALSPAGPLLYLLNRLLMPASALWLVGCCSRGLARTPPVLPCQQRQPTDQDNLMP